MDRKSKGDSEQYSVASKELDRQTESGSELLSDEAYKMSRCAEDAMDRELDGGREQYTVASKELDREWDVDEEEPSGRLWCVLKRVLGGTGAKFEADDINSCVKSGGVVSDGMMIYAVSEGVPWIVKALLDGGGNANVMCAEDGKSLLCIAVTQGCVSTVDILLASGANADGLPMDTFTPLMCAARHNHSGCAIALVNAGASLNAVDVHGCSALLMAVRGGAFEVGKVLLNAGANPNIVDQRYVTPLIEASSGEPRKVFAELLLSVGADVNLVDYYGNSALFYATRYNISDYDVVDDIKEAELYIELLVRAGANVNDVGWNNSTPLINVCRSKAYMGEYFVRVLLDAGADVNAANNEGDTALIVAARCNTAGVVDMLLSRGADINALNSLGSSALITAAGCNELDTVKVLLGAGAVVNGQDGEGRSALLNVFAYPEEVWMRKEVRHRIVEELLEAGADVNHADREGNTALLMVVDPEWRDVRCRRDAEYMLCDLKLLLSGRADASVSGSGDITALMHVCRTETGSTEEMVNALLDHGANINDVDAEGVSALIYGVKCSSVEVVAILLNRGADIKWRGLLGETVAQACNVPGIRGDLMAIVLMRAGAYFSVSDLLLYPRAVAAYEEMKEMKFDLKHLCRESIRLWLMGLHAGKWLRDLAEELDLPNALQSYVADVGRYVNLVDYEDEVD